MLMHVLWQPIRFRLRWRGNSVQVAIGHTDPTFGLVAPDGVSEPIVVGGEPVVLEANQPVTVRLTSS